MPQGGYTPDSAKEQAPSSHFDAGGEIQGAVEGEESNRGHTLTFFWSHSRDEGKEVKVTFGEKKNRRACFLFLLGR